MSEVIDDDEEIIGYTLDEEDDELFVFCVDVSTDDDDDDDVDEDDETVNSEVDLRNVLSLFSLFEFIFTLDATSLVLSELLASFD